MFGKPEPNKVIETSNIKQVKGISEQRYGKKDNERKNERIN